MNENLKSYINSASAEDLPRILRSDMTRMTEMLAKYRALAQGAPDEVAAQIQGALGALATARNALLQVTAVASGYDVPSLVGPGSSEEAAPMPPGGPASPGGTAGSPVHMVGTGGAPMTLSGALSAAKFVSSSAIAKKGIRSGAVAVNGEQTLTDITLSPGTTYELSCGELTAHVQIR